MFTIAYSQFNKIFIFYVINMLFDFQAFIEELREKPEKKQIVEKYEQLV